MDNKGSIRIGPGASSLILIFVMLSLSVLAMLALAGANNDLQMGRRSAQVTEEIYTLYEQAEMTRAQIGELLAKSGQDAADEEAYLRNVAQNIAAEQGADALPQLRIEDGSVCWEEGDGVYTLDCGVALGIPAGTAGEWTRHDLLVDRAQMEDDWDEWS